MRLKLERESGLFEFTLSNERANIIRLSADPKIGGNNSAFRPMEILAGSLAGCSSIDVLNILQKQKLFPSKFRVDLEAERAKDKLPSVFNAIHLIFRVSDDIPINKFKRAVALSINKYCSVSKILDSTCSISYEITNIN